MRTERTGVCQETFAGLWNGYFSRLDHENRTLYDEAEDAFGNRTVKTFDYNGS